METNQNDKKQGLIIAAFAGVGKSYIGDNYNNVLDLESTYYKWIYDEDFANMNTEERKGKGNRILNPLWPNNYIEEILKQKDNYDIVLIQLSHKRLGNESIFEYFDNNNITYYVARPNISAWPIIEQRLRNRGNSEEFIAQCKDNFGVFVEEFSKEKYNQIIINDNEFLLDALLRLNIIKK